MVSATAESRPILRTWANRESSPDRFRAEGESAMSRSQAIGVTPVVGSGTSKASSASAW
jgi:hypothetical protein